ncbi:MAG: flavodoxin family protein [Gemmatimonadota bacterium]
MDVAIVYESLFGNTRSVAEAIADGVRQADPSAHVDLLPVANAKAEQVARAQLLVVGGPTHMRGMTSDMTRRKGLENEEQAARDKGRGFAPEAGAAGPGIRDWFGALPKATPGAHAAAFDTRAGFRLAGGAAKKISQRLRRQGYGLVGKPAGFIIEGTEGPLRDGERDKARAWGAALVSALVQPR